MTEPEKCPKCGAGVEGKSKHFVHFACGADWCDDFGFEYPDLCRIRQLTQQRDRLVVAAEAVLSQQGGEICVGDLDELRDAVRAAKEGM